MPELTQAERHRLATEVMGWDKSRIIEDSDQIWGYCECNRLDHLTFTWLPDQDANQADMVLKTFETEKVDNNYPDNGKADKILYVLDTIIGKENGTGCARHCLEYITATPYQKMKAVLEVLDGETTS